MPSEDCLNIRLSDYFERRRAPEAAEEGEAVRDEAPEREDEAARG